jgi:cell division septation protein DedD
VFDGEPPATKVSDIELRIPDKDKTGELPSGVAMPVVSVASAVIPASAPASVSAPVAASATLPVAAAAIVAVPVVAAAVAQHTQEVKVEQPKTDVVKPIQNEHKVEQKPVVSHTVVPHTGFVVQVGAFSNLGTAKKLQDKLASEGLHVYTEKIGHNVRVRVGSFPTHEAADKVRHKLEAQGLHPNVVNLNN